MVASVFKSVVNRYACIMLHETRTSSLFLGWWSILLSIGFLVGTSTTNGYGFITSHASAEVWSLGFFIYGLFKLYQTIYRVPIWFRLATALQGLWSWSFILISIFLYNGTGILPGQIIYFFPILLEFWDVVVYMYSVCTKSRRDTDICQ